MSLELCVLGSGSAGNSTVVRAPRGVFLLDAGFGPRTTAQRMCTNGGIGVDLPDVAAIVLTHLDHDHFNKNWLQTVVKRGIRIYCAKERVDDVLNCPEAQDVDRRRVEKRWSSTPFAEQIIGFDGPFQPVPGVSLDPISLAHDADGSHGFLMTAGNYRVGFATDLGRVTDELIEYFCGVDVLAIESNYDPDMERTSDRPWFLKQRVMGGKGHLSNDEALAALRKILDRTQQLCGADQLPRHIVLLHRSHECNCPDLVRRLFSTDRRISQVLTLSHQDERTPWLIAGRPRAQVSEQLVLAWG